MPEMTVRLMSRCDYALKVINITGAFIVIGLVYVLDLVESYPVYVKSTASASILYLVLLSGYGPLVVRAMSAEMLIFYIRRVVFVWLFFNVSSAVLYIFELRAESIKSLLIFNSILLTSTLSVPWILHILKCSTLLILGARIIFWFSLIFSFVIDSFWILYVTSLLTAIAQAVSMRSWCENILKKIAVKTNNILCLTDHNAFRVKEIGARLNENITNYLAASILTASSIVVFHAVMKVLSMLASFFYVPIRARLRGESRVINPISSFYRYLIIWVTLVCVIWLVFREISGYVVDVLSISFQSVDIDKYILILKFINQPIFVGVISVIIIHVYVKAKKDFFVWPNISIWLESLGIALSGLYILFIFYNQQSLVITTIILSHFIFLVFRDTLVYYGYKWFT